MDDGIRFANLTVHTAQGGGACLAHPVVRTEARRQIADCDAKLVLCMRERAQLLYVHMHDFCHACTYALQQKSLAAASTFSLDIYSRPIPSTSAMIMFATGSAETIVVVEGGISHELSLWQQTRCLPHQSSSRCGWAQLSPPETQIRSPPPPPERFRLKVMNLSNQYVHVRTRLIS